MKHDPYNDKLPIAKVRRLHNLTNERYGGEMLRLESKATNDGLSSPAPDSQKTKITKE